MIISQHVSYVLCTVRVILCVQDAVARGGGGSGAVSPAVATCDTNSVRSLDTTLGRSYGCSSTHFHVAGWGGGGVMELSARSCVFMCNRYKNKVLLLLSLRYSWSRLFKKFGC